MIKKYHTEEELKAANRARQAKYRVKPESKAKHAAYEKQRYNNNPEVRAKAKARANSQEGIRLRLKINWKQQGIKFASEFDRELWLALAMYDGTVCAVTGMTNAEHKAKFGCRLSLDHDHSTGEPRRFLCRYANTALGVLEQLDLTDEQLNNFISLVKEDRRQAER